MKGSLVVNMEQPQLKPVFLSLIAILVSWVFVFWQGLSTAIDIWLISEIFNHCLFVLPGSAYLIYLKKDELNVNQIKPNYFVLILCLGSLLLYAVGIAGDVKLFMHVATFTFLPLALWAYLGNKVAFQIMFPLAFILFCIPVGEELIPTLQEVTADLSMIMLNWTGIPIYRTGLYIEIPQGKFLVAEACSGISFFIASVVIGSLYSYLNLINTKRRIIFMSISILFPIVANAIRVFGIILTGYLTDMEHAVGADHLIYGWIFFSLVIVCLLGLGELVREKHRKPVINTEKTDPSSKINVKGCYQASAITIIIMFSFFIWFNSINTQLSLRETSQNLKVLLMTEQSIPSTDYESTWKPEFNQPYQEFQFLKKLNGIPVDIYIVWYPKGHGELISSLNRLYPQKVWTLESKSSYQLDDNLNIDLSMIVNPHGKRLLSYWYVVDGKVFTNNRMAKLYEIYKILMGSYTGSGLIAISQITDSVSIEQDKLFFKGLTQDNFVELSQYFDF